MSEGPAKRRWFRPWVGCVACLMIAGVSTFFTPAYARAWWAIKPTWEVSLEVISHTALWMAFYFGVWELLLLGWQAIRSTLKI